MIGAIRLDPSAVPRATRVLKSEKMPHFVHQYRCDLGTRSTNGP
jgi:hypothetical protein